MTVRDNSLLVSVIITSYNYERFLADAIDSALGQSYDNIEIIVVDDGSTDCSREIIESYGERIIPLFQENGGQASAFNTGFRRCRGDVVVFLDADDVLLRDTIERVVTVFRNHSDIARVQYRMEMIDARGRPTGIHIPPPYLPLPNGDMRGDVPGIINNSNWSPTSGNAFAAWSLQQILPMPESPFRICADYYLSRVNALLGPIQSLDRAGAYYRNHDDNHFFRTSIDLEKMREHILLARITHHHVREVAESLSISGYPHEEELVLDEIDLARRVISLKLEPRAHPVQEDSMTSLCWAGIRASLQRSLLSRPVKALHSIWFLTMLLSPRAYAPALARLFFPEQRKVAGRFLQFLNGRAPTTRRLEVLSTTKNASNVKLWQVDDLSTGRYLPDKQPTPIGVVIINHNTRDLLRACVKSVQMEAPCQLIVVDNASDDGSANMMRSEFPEVTLIANAVNRGYGTAANQAVARCRAPYALLVNSDTHLQPGSLHALSCYLDLHPKAAAVGPRLLGANGSLQPSCFPFPSPLHLLVEETGLGRLIGKIPFLREHYLRTWSHGYSRIVPWVMGAALAIRREVFEAVNGFDESFFMYFEEVDLCYRLRKCGWTIHYDPSARVVHVGGASTGQQRVNMSLQLLASMEQFYRHHYSRFKWLKLMAILKTLALIRWMRDEGRIHLTRDEVRRARLIEDIEIWQATFSHRLQEPSR